MNDQEIDRIADAVLYEGYLLYPYRKSVKNVQRWTFGGLYPRLHSQALGHLPPWQMRTEILLAGLEDAVVSARVRFLQVETRRTHGRPEETWQEGIERSCAFLPRPLSALRKEGAHQTFFYPAASCREPLPDGAGTRIRSTAPLLGELRFSADSLGRGVHRLSLTVSNRTDLERPEDPEEAERGSLMATHVILRTEGGRFISLTDPPADWAQAAKTCRNTGNWPVLVGDPASADAVLGSPIILPDHPQLAPESPGDLFDCTENDEILSLRIRALSESERREVAALDPRGKALLDRTEALARRDLERLHGTWRIPEEVTRAI